MSESCLGMIPHHGRVIHHFFFLFPFFSLKQATCNRGEVKATLDGSDRGVCRVGTKRHVSAPMASDSVD